MPSVRMKDLIAMRRLLLLASRQLKIFAVGGPTQQLVLDDMYSLGHLLFVHRVKLGQPEELACGLGHYLPAVGLGFRHPRGDHPLAIQLLLLLASLNCKLGTRPCWKAGGG